MVWGNVSGLIFSVDSNPKGERHSVAPLIVPMITLDRVQIEPLSLSHSQGMFELWSQFRVCEYAGLTSDSLGECSEYAYHFVPRWWGRGLAAEASRGALDWSLSHGSSSIEVFISPSNRRSIQLAEQLGFEPTSDLVDDSQRFILSQIG